jgi:hypothetical protein
LLGAAALLSSPSSPWLKQTLPSSFRYGGSGDGGDDGERSTPNALASSECVFASLDAQWSSI